MIMVFQKNGMPALVGTLSFAKAHQTMENKIPRVRCLLITPETKERGRYLLFTSGGCNKYQQLLPGKKKLVENEDRKITFIK
jgi:hypothetical protein